MITVAAPRSLRDRLDYVKAPRKDQIADNDEIAGLVAGVLADVRERGDEAVRD